MAFTQDEIQTLNTIFEQKLLQHRYELERSFDQRLHTLQHELEQRLVSAQQELLHTLTQRLSDQQEQDKDATPDFDAIEVQTEIPWEEFTAIIGRALDERLSPLDGSLQSLLKNIEYRILSRLRELRNELIAHQSAAPREVSPPNMQEVFTSIDHLEQIVESMQVAMTTNHALLSHRLYHHQQLPLERVHVPGQSTTSAQSLPPNTGQLSIPKEP